MANIYDDIDLKFSYNGDYDLSSGDLADTSEDGLLSLRQQLHSIMASSFKDWEIYPNFGAGLNDFVGEANTRSTARTLQDRIRTSIISTGIVAEQDLQIKVTPVHIHKVLVTLLISAVATPNNNLSSNKDRMVISLVFDFVEQGIFFPEKPLKLLGGS